MTNLVGEEDATPGFNLISLNSLSYSIGFCSSLIFKGVFWH